MSLCWLIVGLVLAMATSVALAGNNCTFAKDCLQYQCASNERNSWIIALLWAEAKQPAFNAYWSNLASAIKMLGSFGPLISNDLIRPHITTQYICCQNETALQTIASTMQAQRWDALNVTFDRLVCNNDMHNGTNTTSIVARLSDASQVLLGRAVADFERAIIAAGVPIVHRRASQEFFHSTVAVVDRGFPSDLALAHVNAQITHWTGALGPIRVFNLMMLDPIDFFFAQKQKKR
jgi:hypothetical protein